MRIGIIAHWMNPNMVEMARLLISRGVKLDLIYPEQQLIDVADIRVKNDLYLLKSGNELALSFAFVLHQLGAATVNPYPTVALLQNKIVSTRILQKAGVPTPDTFVTRNRGDLAPLLDEGPLIVKPYRGCRGEGIAVVRTVGDLDKLAPDGPILAQRYHQSDDGRDHKIFCIGDRLFGVRRIFPLRSYDDKVGEPFVLTPELRSITQRCGEAVGIDLYGVDVVISNGQPYVVDLNKFCSFIGVKDAPRLLADHVLESARRVLRGESLLITPAVVQARPDSELGGPPSSLGLSEEGRHPALSEEATS